MPAKGMTVAGTASLTVEIVLDQSVSCSWWTEPVPARKLNDRIPRNGHHIPGIYIFATICKERQIRHRIWPSVIGEGGKGTHEALPLASRSIIRGMVRGVDAESLP